MPERIRADLHTHTRYSPDSLTTVEQLVDAARKRGLSKVAVTDHNSMRGAWEAQALAPDLVIPGEEIMSTGGEILAFYLRKEVPPGLTPAETIERLQAQDAVISIPHPFDSFRSRWRRAELAEIASCLDAVEGLNARCFSHEMNRQAQSFAAEHGLGLTAGSDGHWRHEVGRAYLTLPDFHDAATLRAALRAAEIGGRRAGFWVRFYSTYVRLRRMLGAT